MVKIRLNKIIRHNIILKDNRGTFLGICFVILSTFAFSQKKSSYNNPEHSSENFMKLKYGWSAGVDVGTTLFYGDITLYNTLPNRSQYNVSAGRGYSIFGGKKFKFGLSAELQVFKGTLKGEKRADHLYPRYFRTDLMGYSVNAKYNLSQLIFRKKNDRKLFNRLTLYFHVGVGQAFYRSRLYKYLGNNDQWYLERVNGFSSSGIDSAGSGLVTKKAKTTSTIILPIGAKVNFKLNGKTDLVFDFNYVTAFTDNLDSWSRSWSHKDRYLYTGLGIIYNFGNEESEDVPDSDRLFRIKKGSKSDSESGDDAYDGSSKSTGTLKRGLFTKRAQKEDKDLDIKLKLYELQLKLFEMQYLVQ